MRYLINADDFGQTLSCTKAIAQAMEEGLITDTTMVANGEPEAFCLATELATTAAAFAGRVGIHFNLTEGTPLTGGILQCSNFVTDGQFHGKINRLHHLSKQEKAAVYEELTAQIKRLQNSGIAISHADSHHHIHTAIFIAPIVMGVCRENGITKMRLHRNVGVTSALKKAVKALYNRKLRKNFTSTECFGSAEDMAKYTTQGLTEIMVHPDYDSQGVLIDRTDTENGFPVGVPLNSAVGAFTKDTTNYEAI